MWHRIIVSDSVSDSDMFWTIDIHMSFHGDLVHQLPCPKIESVVQPQLLPQRENGSAGKELVMPPAMVTTVSSITIKVTTTLMVLLVLCKFRMAQSTYYSIFCMFFT